MRRHDRGGQARVGPSAQGVDQSLLIRAAPRRVVAAFFDPSLLAVWWQVVRSVTTPRVLGAYAVEWERSAVPDEILGPLGGVFHGTVVDFDAGRGFLVADAWWLPPEGDPLGPMALEVSCAADGAHARLRVRQSGFELTPRWRRYYEIVDPGWRASLAALRQLLERGDAAGDP
ncbi:MAG TPA: SRPBCC domain-containing protein [Vicinamibacterales bacterium]|nr:SRPBCC domain-containing protein [Vicinamibacterales bacterium]